jgi:hypothetical protein
MVTLRFWLANAATRACRVTLMATAAASAICWESDDPVAVTASCRSGGSRRPKPFAVVEDA